MPPSIEDEDYDSEMDVLILEELLDTYSLSFPLSSILGNVKTLAKGFYPPSLHILSFNWESCIQILSTNVLSFGTPNKWPYNYVVTLQNIEDDV
nr:hypothetical protein [Tanacetum cinerariifolium]